MTRIKVRSKSKKKPQAGLRFSLAVKLCLVAATVLSQLVMLRRQHKNDSASDLVIFNHHPQLEESKTALSSPPTTRRLSQQKGLPRVLAIVFPQYHSDPLNDRLWGKGFTDWDNLRAAPQFNRLGLEIPRPTELGYYDMTDPTVRKRQGELAQEYGIDGFVYHHYWFYDPAHPGPSLHAPLMGLLQDGHPNVPFCLHWCATSWLDTWMGKSNSSGTGNHELQKQYFPKAHDPAIIEHYNWLKQFFHHPNYIRIQGQPVFMIYKRKPSSYAILMKLKNWPNKMDFPGVKEGQERYQHPKSLFNRTIAYPYPHEWMQGKTLQIPDWCLDPSTHKRPRHILEIPGILTSFDNTPRRSLSSAHLWSPDPPNVVVERFHESLKAAVYYEACCLGTTATAKEDSFVLVNSMNEWAEGMSLEPSTVFGRRLLEAVRRVKEEVRCNENTG